MTGVLMALAAFFLVLVLPGLPFAMLLLGTRPIYWILILAAGLSLAINPLILLMTTQLGVRFDYGTLLAVYGIAALASAILFIRFFRTSQNVSKSRLVESWQWPIALLALSIVVFFLRWLPLTPLAVTTGVDTSQHVAITAMILENQAIPSNYEPFWGLSSFSYHFGFHANAAAFSLFSGLPPHKTLSILGPYLVSFAPLSVFVLTVTLFKSERMALIAAILTGLVSVFPAFYLNWGRLPQLAGVVVVPLVMALLFESYKSKPSRNILLLTSLLVAGLFLIHYRMFFFLLYGAIALLAARFVETRKVREVGKSALRLVPVAVLAFLMVLPWFVTLMGSPLAVQFFERDPAPQAYSLARIVEPLSYSSSLWIFLLSLVGFGLAAIYRKVEFTLLLGWSAVGLLLSNPFYIPGPFSGLLDTVTWVTSMFVVQSMLVALVPVIALTLVRQRWRLPRSTYPAVVGTVVLLGILGTGVISTEGYETVLQEDLDAFDWIVENVPHDAVFVTNVRIDPILGSVQPLDAGIWITYFTGRKQLAPPLLYKAERPPVPDYAEQLRQMASHEETIGSLESYLFFRDLGATHVYLGAKGTGPMRLEDLIASPSYFVIYQDGDVVIAELRDLSDS